MIGGQEEIPLIVNVYLVMLKKSVEIENLLKWLMIRTGKHKIFFLKKLSAKGQFLGPKFVGKQPKTSPIGLSSTKSDIDKIAIMTERS